MASDRNELVDFVIEESFVLPAPRRARVLRGLAGIVGNQDETAELLKIADALESAQRRQRRLQLTFRHSKNRKGGKA